MSLIVAFSFGMCSLITADMSGCYSTNGQTRPAYATAAASAVMMLGAIVATLFFHGGCK